MNNSLLRNSMRCGMLILLGLLVGGIHAQAEPQRNAIDWQPNGHIIAHVSDGRLVLFDTIAEQNLDILPDMPDNLFLAMWSNDGTRLAASDTTGAVYIWSITNDHLSGNTIAN